ncbi:MAG: dihydroorotate dehydrogenase electron transfer subunit [Pirellulales bacterium]|nr:dihydroorotate dehydrogenase electron transfer subunit [Pirellulales bacterium]
MSDVSLVGKQLPSAPLEAAGPPYFADGLWQGTVEIMENVQLAQDTFRVRFRCPEIARKILPGQFLMLRMSGCNDPLLGRPFALYDTTQSSSGAADGLDVVYLVIGKFTSRLSQALPGERLDVWGPLGNGFSAMPAEHLIMVAGGIGQTPFLAVAREALELRRYGEPLRRRPRVNQVTLCYGARTQEFLASVEDFQELGVDVRVSTDDGSFGHAGLVTEVLESVLDQSRLRPTILCCGPEPMMAAVARISSDRNIPCEVSLETPMACGVGICFSCVAKVRQPDGRWDYRRTCVEGPVFGGQQIDFS